MRDRWLLYAAGGVAALVVTLWALGTVVGIIVGLLAVVVRFALQVVLLGALAVAAVAGVRLAARRLSSARHRALTRGAQGSPSAHGDRFLNP